MLRDNQNLQLLPSHELVEKPVVIHKRASCFVDAQMVDTSNAWFLARKGVITANLGVQYQIFRSYEGRSEPEKQ